MSIPAPTQELIARLHEVGRMLDRCVPAASDTLTAGIFQEYSNTVYAAAARVGQLAEALEDLLAPEPAPAVRRGRDGA